MHRPLGHVIAAKDFIDTEPSDQVCDGRSTPWLLCNVGAVVDVIGRVVQADAAQSSLAYPPPQSAPSFAVGEHQIK